MAAAVAAVVGKAVIGAALGGIIASISGGNVLKGMKGGAIGGALAGVIGQVSSPAVQAGQTGAITGEATPTITGETTIGGNALGSSPASLDLTNNLGTSTVTGMPQNSGPGLLSAADKNTIAGMTDTKGLILGNTSQPSSGIGSLWTNMTEGQGKLLGQTISGLGQGVTSMANANAVKQEARRAEKERLAEIERTRPKYSEGMSQQRSFAPTLGTGQQPSWLTGETPEGLLRRRYS